MDSLRAKRSLRWAGAVLAIVLCTGAQPAGARATPPRSVYTACMARATTTRDMQACQSAAVAEVDRRLKIALGNALAALPADQQLKLRASQQRWVDFRLSDCRVFFGDTSGTDATVLAGGCMIERAASRIIELNAFSAK